MKRYIAIFTYAILLVLLGNTAAAQAAKAADPEIDTKGAEALKKQPADKTVVPDIKRPVLATAKQEPVARKEEAREDKEELVNAVQVEPRPAPVAQDRPRVSTIDLNKQPPSRTPVTPMVSAQAQKVE